MPERSSAYAAADRLACELAEWPWFVRCEVRGPSSDPRIVAVLNVPVDAPGDLWCVVGGFNVFREGSTLPPIPLQGNS